MTFKQYLKQYSEEYSRTANLWYKSKLFGMYNQLKSNEKNYHNNIEKYLNNQNKFTEIFNNYKKEQIGLLNSQDIGVLFVEIDQLRNSLNEKNEITKSIGINIQKIIQELVIVNQQFNNVFRKPEDFALLKNLLNNIDIFNDEFNRMKQNLEHTKEIDKLLENETMKKDGFRKMTFTFLDESNDFDEFTETLEIFRDIYNELINLFRIDIQNNKLEIVKIESGSKLIDVFGLEPVLEFIKWFITEIVRELFKNFTNTGKIEKINYSLPELDKQFNLIEKLNKLNKTLPEEERLNLSEITEDLTRSVGMITKRTMQLIKKQTKIDIDGEKIALDDSLREKYITENMKNLIESKE